MIDLARLRHATAKADEYLARHALAAAASGGDVEQAPAESPQSGGDSRNAQRRSA